MPKSAGHGTLGTGGCIPASPLSATNGGAKTPTVHSNVVPPHCAHLGYGRIDSLRVGGQVGPRAPEEHGSTVIPLAPAPSSSQEWPALPLAPVAPQPAAAPQPRRRRGGQRHTTVAAACAAQAGPVAAIVAADSAVNIAGDTVRRHPSMSEKGRPPSRSHPPPGSSHAVM